MDVNAIHHIAWVRETNLYGSEREPWVKAKVFSRFLVYKKKLDYLNISVISQSVGSYFNELILSVNDVLFI
jgi:hypothetical protein